MMQKKCKLVSLLLSALFLLGYFTINTAATVVSPSTVAIYSKSDLTFNGSGQVRGDAIIESGKLSGSNNLWSTGTIYKTLDVEIKDNHPVNQSVIKDYTGLLETFTLPEYKAFPTETFFAGKGDYTDGTKDVTIGWGKNDFADNYTINNDSYIDSLEISDTLNLNISVNTGEVRILRIKDLKNRGFINVIGGGKAILYVDVFSPGGSANYNTNGSQDNLSIFISGEKQNAILDNLKMNANVFVPYSNLQLNNATINGNIYVGKDLHFTNSGKVTGFVFAPNSDSNLDNSAAIIGQLITKSAKLNGSAYVEAGQVTSVPNEITSILQVVAPTPDPDPDPDPNPDPDPDSDPDPDPNPDPQPIKMVSITAVVARRMSIRLEDGRILKKGDKFDMPEGSTVKFQMCTNNWGTDTYTDDGNGVAGAKVFEYTHVKNKEKYLRVDNDRFFRYVKFHFQKGDYLKLTGVDQVLPTPLESLSINFPLGSTIKVDAYVKNTVVETKYLFIDSSVYSYTWNY